MTKRSYHQYCNIAYALDIVGERWTLLIVRELFMGPKRFKDLLANLPGIASNLLTQRLNHLEEHDVITHEMLPPPISAPVYKLTRLGRELEIVLKALHRWGSYTYPKPDEEDVFRPGWSALAMQFSFKPHYADGLRAVILYRIGDTVFHAKIRDRVIKSADGLPGEDVDLEFIMDEETFEAIVTQKTTMKDEIKAEKVEWNGRPDLIEPSLEVFGLTYDTRGEH